MWERLLGLYGDSLLRKFGDEPPQEWVAGLTQVSDYQLSRGMRRLLFGGKAHAPSLPEFVKLCRSIGHSDDIPDEVPQAHLPALTRHEPEADRWVIAGNRRLLRHIFTALSGDPKCFGKPASVAAMQDPSRIDDKTVDAGPAFVHNVKTLVAFKNRWVEVMQETATAEGVPVNDQMMFWKECIRDAESQFRKESA